MRVEYFWLAGATVSAFAGAAARADEQPVTVLKPASEWNLNYAEDRCRLGRLFGGGTDETIFWIEQSAPSASFSWLIAGGVVDRLRSTSRVTVAFGPGFEPFDAELPIPKNFRDAEFELAGYGKALQSTGYYQESPTNESIVETASQQLDREDGAKIEFVEFKSGERRVRLATGNLAAAFTAMNACTANLYEFWGVAGDFGSDVVEQPRPKNQRDWAPRIQRHYPIKAKLRGEDAALTLKALIGSDGRVEKCITIKNSRAENFDESACDTVKEYAEFEPARDKNGSPTRSFYTISVVYETN